VKLARRQITLAPKPRKPSPCPICHSRSGFCVVVVFPPQWWGSRRPRTARRPSK